jgi:DNA mismatch repair ATPase MutS
MNKTMRLRYGWDGVMLIDSGTLKSLEILQSRRTGESKQSLFAVIDRTVTPQGGSEAPCFVRGYLSVWLTEH